MVLRAGIRATLDADRRCLDDGNEHFMRYALTYSVRIIGGMFFFFFTKV